MGEILTNHNATKLDPNLTNVGYLTSSGKKAVGVIGEVMLVDHHGSEVNMSDLDISSTVVDASCYVGKSATATNGDFDVAYTAATQLTFSNYPTGITGFTTTDIQSIVQINSLGDVVVTYHRDDARMSLVADVLTVTGAAFTNTDTFIVFTNVPAIGAYDDTNDAIKIVDQFPIYEHYLEASIADTTNVANNTYYPASTGMSLGEYKNMTITGKLIDGAGETTTLTVEAMNDEDTAAGDWVQIYGYDSKNNTSINSVAATNETKTYVWDFDNINYRYIRFKIAATAATNTVIIKIRRSY